MRFQIFSLLLFTLFITGKAQNDVSVLNHYKYVYLTAGSMPQYMRFSLYDDTAERFKDCGLKVIKKQDKLQITDTCSIVYCELQRVPWKSNQACVILSFTDCNRQSVFASKPGYSGILLGDSKWGYENALTEALQSFDNYHYSYLK